MKLLSNKLRRRVLTPYETKQKRKCALVKFNLLVKIENSLLWVMQHSPTVFETYVTDVQVDGTTVTLTLYDTAGQEDYDRLRHLTYPETDIALVCFSVDSPESARNVIQTWIIEVRYYCGQCPLILVACKKDLRTNPEIIAQLKELDEIPVSNAVGKRIAAEIKADAYIECSAKTREGVQDLFIQAARLSVKKSSRRKRRGNCVLC
ncbi:unnamed protein product [Rotaria magnacalcarata]